MKFEIDEDVIIIKGDHKFAHGKILECAEIYGAYVYTVDLLDGTCVRNIFEQELLSTNPAKNTKDQFTVMTFDIEKYLKADQMEEIAKGIFIERITKRIDDALEARRGKGSMVDLMVHEITTDYAKRLGDKFETELVQRIKEVIYMKEESTEEDWDDTFLGSIKNVLWSTTGEWVKEHKDEVMGWIVPELKSFIKELMMDCATTEISKRFGSIISESFNQVIKDIYENSLTAGMSGN